MTKELKLLSFYRGFGNFNGKGGYKEAMTVEYSGTFKGTVLGETMVMMLNPTKIKQMKFLAWVEMMLKLLVLQS